MQDRRSNRVGCRVDRQQQWDRVTVSPLRQRLIDEMDVRRFGGETQRNYIGDVGRFATSLGRLPDTATAEDVRRFQVEQGHLGVPAPTMNAIVSALQFFFTQTLDRPDLARKLVGMRHERKLPVVLSRDKVARLTQAELSALVTPSCPFKSGRSAASVTPAPAVPLSVPVDGEPKTP